MDQPWMSPRFREIYLETVLPGGLILFAILHDCMRGLTFPKPLRVLSRRIYSPFRNFLTLEDVMDPAVKVELRGLATTKARVLSGLAFFMSASWLSCLAYAIFLKDINYSIRSFITLITWGYIASITTIKPPTSPPYIYIFFASYHVLVSTLEFGIDALDSRVGVNLLLLDTTRMIIPIIFIWVGGMFPLQPVRFATNIARPDDVPSVALSCPEDDVTLWSWSTFSFVEPIFCLSQRRTLNDEDVWSLSPFFRHDNIFNKCLEYRDAHPTHSLLRFLLVSNSLDLILDVTLELWSTIVGFVPPYALKEILSALSNDSPNTKHTTYIWAIITFLAHLSFAQVDLFKRWHSRRCYERTRGQLFCSLHHKSLRRQDMGGHAGQAGDERKSADLGKIVNLMQGDSYAVAQRFWDFSDFFTSPIRLMIALVFLYQVLGWSALSGVVVILVAYALNFPLAKYNISITRSSWKAKDARMGVVNELLQNIRFLKFYGWENHWASKAQRSRDAELQWRIKENIVDTAISFIWTWIPSATALTSFLCYTLIAGERLTVSKAFTSIALFSQLQEPMTALPGQFFAMLHAYVSMQRIEEFLDEREVPEWASSLTGSTPAGSDGEFGISNATFEWPSPSGTLDGFKLGPINIVFPKGKLTLVSGPTGSGKSALLSALLGEMHCIEGQVFINKMNHRIAYCGQTPWLEHATIRDNIVFGCAYGFDENRYQTVIDACALLRDFEVLDAADLTEIGERGITLSGGQRARVALARAMYSEAEYILLDDPLSAVDMHTAQHIVSKCLKGDLVRGRTVILITHHISLCLPMSSYLVELSHGEVLHQGTIEELQQFGLLQNVIAREDEPPIQVQDPQTPDNEADGDGVDVRVSKKLGSGKLVDAESRAEGRVSWRTYITYIRATGFFSWFLTVVLMLLIRFINIGNQVFLARWGEAYSGEERSLVIHHLILTLPPYPWTSLPSPDIDVKPWLMIYLYISVTGAFAVLFYIALGYYASLQASRSLFISLLRRLTRAPARFFDITPIGRILNRFTTDMNTIDGALQDSARKCLSGTLNFVASFTVILIVIPTFAPFAIFIAWLYIRLAPPYIRTSRDLRRLESVSLSPAFAGYDELLRGISHIRAFGMENRYQNGFYAKVDKFQSFDHVYWLVNGWLRWRYNCLGSVVVFSATMFALWKGVTNGSTAIVIVQAGIFAEASRQLVKVAAQLELDFNSVERIVEYLDVPQEAPAIVEKYRPPAYWPSSVGGLEIENLSVQYAPHLPPVLRNISFAVKPSEKIGIVGRTGSGKSTLALSLLRMIEASSGRIIIDGIDIAKLGLEVLRTSITIISQDVSLFSGTIRSNLDPLDEHSTRECIEVMERCHLTKLLKHTSMAHQDTLLDMPITQGSLSAGERQLVAIARAILRRTNIIIMDEATSQIDSQLDDQIQRTIREELSGAIVLTIAHRLKTIMDYDRVLVLGDGEILEFGKPKALLETPNGAFRDMCRRSSDWALLADLVDGE
ncbi:P-loop containing nucleoside triphosphate hydrolase protein [Collybia nuda]|uniref:P-loop containing nucleoside triphosphate hydrolase protein n=1 Tax=Collybia nuda TaxID=64659 RepID=A0A9P6CKR2_9AGAR|nr:P-loop containing nucleoside triphosphate hydrolase protein [Collybia nuda]